MLGGTQQGGGGKEFLNLTGLFMSQSGKSMVGSVKPEAFNSLFAMMQKAHAAGVELVFLVNGPGNNTRPDSKLKARLSVTLGNPPRSATPVAPAGPFGPPVGGAAATVPVAPTLAAFGFGGQPANNPPKDDLESFLESFDNK